MQNGIIYFMTLAVLVCLTLIVVDASKVAGFDMDTHPTFRWVMMAAYAIIILSFLAVIGAILWRGFRGQRTRR